MTTLLACVYEKLFILLFDQLEIARSENIDSFSGGLEQHTKQLIYRRQTRNFNFVFLPHVSFQT